ncbi:MAG: heavy-metal-associated domain-containing protein [Burkholderiales bacterium]|jgi:Cu+-exporting ATPase|nr:heavy-metal-associated domain-containing protein [Burkholderiales bacterium]
MQTTELKVDGMTCGSCVASVTKALRRVPGVQDVEVDLGSGIARIRGEHAAHQVPELIAALGEAGYGAGPATAAPATHRQHPAGGCGAGSATKGRGGCCGG